MLRDQQADPESALIDEAGETVNAVTFIVFGALVLGPALENLTSETAAYAILRLTVVRMLPVLMARAGTGARRQTVAFI
ncbi:MAG: hypothetical protein JHD02_02495 [Thermoleophilaceae bacterium]|nr:hypothetical protein [Thermoleophilaceae bacterium]